MRIKEIAAVRVRYGYKRIHLLLRREGWQINHKRVYRLYYEESLNLRRKRPRRHKTAAGRVQRPQATRPNESWSMDFVSDALYDGQRLRALSVLDNFTRESLAIEVDKGITGERVAEVLNQIAGDRDLLNPSSLTTVPNSSPRPWINGLTRTGSPLTFPDQVSRQTRP